MNKNNYLKLIENEIVDFNTTRVIKNYSINKSDLISKYNIGKYLSEAGKHYGEGIVKEYSLYLTSKYGSGYSISNLKNMKKFFLLFKKGQALPDFLSWSHYCELLPIKDINKINYYIDISIKECLSYRDLRKRIKSNEYERLDEDTRNKLVKENNTLSVTSLVKNPILIKNTSNNKEISEKVLQRLILEDLPSFMKELGEGFSFIDNEYKIKVGDSFNYIDLLLYNVIYKCYVVVELKVVELNSSHTGQIQNYMNYIDKNLKHFDDNKSVGIIICRKDNKYVIEYCSDSRIISREYKII